MEKWKVPVLTDIKFLKKLGKGGSGVVYQAQSDSLGLVAAKTIHLLLHPESLSLQAGGAVYLKVENHFRKEVETMMKFSHSNIIKCHGVFFMDKDNRKIPLMVFELGECAFDAFLFSNNVSRAQALYFAIQIVEGIKYLHENSVAHRDIKPGNMVLCKEGSEYIVKLIDFGESKIDSKKLMQTAVGTSAYMDPKVLTGDYDKSVDIYSFGCVLFQ